MLDGAPSLGLFTDLYHPDAAYASWLTGRNDTVTFDLYTRRAPFSGGYLLVAGLAPALDFIRDFRYSQADLEYLASVRAYDPDFLHALSRLCFSGEVLAMPEGTVAFPNEPILRVTGPFREALLLESGLLHLVGISTLLATKAARIVHAAAGRPVAEFAFRRAHNPHVVARSGFIGGCASTSFVEAARRYGIPPSGTMPHALVQLFPTEAEAFRAVARAFPNYTLLIDTYDVGRAVQTAVEVARDAERRWGHRLAAVRLDSGDLDAGSRDVRAALNAAGMHDTRILASGDLDEWSIATLVQAGAPVDGFGVGTSLGVAQGDHEIGVPGGALGTVYKAVWGVDAGGHASAMVKVAGDKSTWPGRKAVYRLGSFAGDVVQLEDEPPPPGGRPLLEPAVRDGMIIASAPSLPEIQARARAELAALPEEYHRPDSPPAYPVRNSERVVALRAAAVARMARGEENA